MIRCMGCGVYFFLQESQLEHEKYCIGYIPNKVKSINSFKEV